MFYIIGLESVSVFSFLQGTKDPDLKEECFSIPNNLFYYMTTLAKVSKVDAVGPGAVCWLLDLLGSGALRGQGDQD